MTSKTYYEILDVSSSATFDEIKESYRLHAAAWHPDKHVGANKKRAEEKMKELNEAYRVLSNPQARASYHKSVPQKSKVAPVEVPDLVLA